MVLGKQSPFVGQNGPDQGICTLHVIFSEGSFSKICCHLGKFFVV